MPDVRLTPEGHLLLEPDARAPSDAVAPAPDARREPPPAGALAELGALLPAAPGRFLWELARRPPSDLAGAGATLPPALAHLRALGALYLHRLCLAPDLEARREPPPVEIPDAEVRRWVESAPPMAGGEYLDEARARVWLVGVAAAAAEAVRDEGGSVADYLRAAAPGTHVVGRVHFHLAENPVDPARPFAFLATYVPRLGDDARARHRPLGLALADHAGDPQGLLRLLLPVARAAEASPLVRRWYDEGLLYQPRAITPDEAHALLREVPACEAAGIVVRVPDWWRARPRVKITATVGQSTPSLLGLDTLLDFRVGAALDGEPLTPAEWRALLAAEGDLVRLKGRWVEVDREKLSALLGKWKELERAIGEDGLSLRDAMRLLAGAEGLGGAGALAPLAAAGEEARDWSAVVAGSALREAIAALRDPAAVGDLATPRSLRATLRGYQETGLRWLVTLYRLGLGGCLADDMGLGKTVQVLALLLAVRGARRERGDGRPHLLVVPASLVGNWLGEIERFAPDLAVRVEHPSLGGRADPDAELVVTTYGQLAARAPLREAAWDVAILDEAQAIRNAGTKQSRAARGLRARVRIALTGTPVENRLADLWALFDFCAPGLLGGADAFGRYTKRLASTVPPDYAPLRRLTRPYLLRRLKSDPAVAPELPPKTELRVACGLSKRQAALYERSVAQLAESLRATKGDADPVRRRGVVLAYLTRFKQICNHPAHFLGEGGDWPEAESGKLAALAELCAGIAGRGEKALVFTQYREATAPLAATCARAFGRGGLVLHGGTRVGERQALVRRFQEDDAIGFFVLSLKAGGTGLNLTAAQHVVHFDRWWNPAVEDQATDRAYRIGQRRAVLVHKLVCRGTVEERIDRLIAGKRALATEVVEGGGEALLTAMDDQALLELVSLDSARALGE